MTGITSSWMIGMELLTLGWWQELHPYEWLGWNYKHWGDDRNYILMNDWDGIINIGVMTGITSLWMIGMELLTLGWRQESQPHEWLGWNYSHWADDRNYIFMNDWDGITNIGVVTGITSLWMIGIELLALGWWHGLTSLWMIGMELLTLGWRQELHPYEWSGWSY